MSECKETVTGFFQEDHRRLDRIFEELLQAFKDGTGEVRDLFDRFDAGLRQHIGWEENLLFPLFEQRTGMSVGGPTEVMRGEHRQIEQVLTGLQQGVEQEDAQALDQDREALADILGAHNVKEEQVLYPSIDNLLDDSTCRELFAKIRGEG